MGQELFDNCCSALNRYSNLAIWFFIVVKPFILGFDSLSDGFLHTVM